MATSARNLAQPLVLMAVLAVAPVGPAGAAPGDLDPTFGVGGVVTTDIGGWDDATSVAIQSDGKIVAAGNAYNGSDDDFAVARYNSDGTLDTSFGVDGKVTTPIGTLDEVARAVVIQPDGKIVAAGFSHDSVSAQDFALVRYNTDGSLDTTFGGDGKVTTMIGATSDLASAVAVQPDGKIVAAGVSHGGGSYDDFAIVRYNTDGSLDTTFDGDGKLTTEIGSLHDLARSVAIQADGKIIAAGSSSTGLHYDFAVARYNIDGSLDTTFDGDGKLTTVFGIGALDDSVRSVAIQTDGKIVAAGISEIGGGDHDFALARYNTDGSLDAAFAGDGKLMTTIGGAADGAESVAIQSDGKIIAAGVSDNGSNNDFALARYNTDGSLDTTFDGDGKLTTAIGSSDERVRSVVIQSDGKIVVAGRAFIGSSKVFAVARYEGDPTLCGNGSTDPGEDCDDGNTDNGDCCSALCEYEPLGSPCPDANVCNGDDTCDGAGTCSPGALLDCTDDDLCTQDSCDPIDGCVNLAEPAATCLDTWTKGSLLVKETVGGKEKLVAKFIKGPALTQGDFGDPLDIDGTAYTACIYDDEGAFVESLEVDRAGLACGEKACWKTLGPRGYLYKDREASADGVQQIRLLAGEDGKSKILIKGGNNLKKGQLDLPVGIAAALSDTTSATVQLFGSDAPACFSMTVDNIKKSETHIFKAVK